MYLMTEHQTTSVRGIGNYSSGAIPAGVGTHQEAQMGQWKRTLRNTGISLTVAGVGVMGAAGAASAHGVGPQEFVRGTVTTVGTGTITITTHKGTMETIDTTTTTYSETGTLVAPTGVTDGQDVLVKLDPADSTPTAVEITVILDRVSGKVTAF